MNIDDESILVDCMDTLYHKNLFAYCNNSPIRRIDTDGEFWHIVVGVAVGAVTGLASNLISQAMDPSKPFNLQDCIIDTLAGAIGGGLTSAGFGAVASGIVSGTAELTKQALSEDFNGSFDVGKIAVSATIGSVSSKIGGNPKVSSQGNYANSVAKQTSKRILNTVTHSSKSVAKNEVKKAISYGVKNSISSALGKDLFSVLTKSGGATIGLSLSQAMTYRAMGIL